MTFHASAIAYRASAWKFVTIDGAYARRITFRHRLGTNKTWCLQSHLEWGVGSGKAPTLVFVYRARYPHSSCHFFDVFEDPNRSIVRAECGRVQDQ